MRRLLPPALPHGKSERQVVLRCLDGFERVRLVALRLCGATGARAAALFAVLGLLTWIPPSTLHAEDSGYAKCRAIKDDKDRLNCLQAEDKNEKYKECRNKEKVEDRTDCFRKLDEARAGSYLERAWGLEEEKFGRGTIQPYRDTYVLVGKWTNNVDTQPSSPAPDHTVSSPIEYQSPEAKFQLSFKSELRERYDFPHKFLGLANVRPWFAYTQLSFWQLYTPPLSRPFRETNYEPEAFLTFGTGNRGDGWQPKLLNVGLVHQSNGQNVPLSRSWNRAYLQGGWEWGEFSVLARAWWRFPEDPEKDDNPDIQDYLGRGDFRLRWHLEGDQTISALLRYAFNSGRGFVEIGYTFPEFSKIGWGQMRLYAQVTSGYGESLIGYNFKQDTIGFGLVYNPL